MIELINVCKSFENKEILQNISTVFEEGKCNLIIGASGSGKTVLMKSMVGLHPINSGEILFDNRNFADISSNDIQNIRQEIGMVFQNGALFDSMNVIENVMFPLTMFTKQTLEERYERATFCLKRVNLDNAAKLHPSELSGGMRKRVSIARAIVNNPRYLFCDEPNSGLDPHTSIVIDNLIQEITHEYHITTVINTHDMKSVMEIGDKIIFINKGQLWWEGNKRLILHTENQEVNDFVYCSELTRYLKK